MNTYEIDRRRFVAAGCATASMAAWPARGDAAAIKADIVMAGGVSGFIVQEVARAKGFFSDFNIDPNVLVVSDGTKSVAAVLSGSSQICAWSGFNQLTPAIERGAMIKILAGSLNIPSLCFYSARDDIHTVADLKGKTIGIGALGSVLHQMTVLLLRKKGVDPDTVTFRNVGSNADIFKAVISKTVDAGPSDVDVFDQQKKYGVHALSDGMLWTELPEYTNQATYASDDAIHNNRDLLVRVLAAYGKAYRFICGPGSRDTFIQARQKVTGIADPTQGITEWTWIQKYQPYAKDLVLSDERINFVQRANVDFKIQKKVMPVSQVADMSLARDALKLLA